ncbi:MAG: helix-turn-helix domain-containing protein [Bacteroidales bacterium]
MKQLFFYAAMQNMPKLLFIPFYVGMIVYLTRILYRYKTNGYVKRILMIIVSLSGFLLLPNDDPDILIIQYCFFTTPLLLLIYQRMGLVDHSMKLFTAFIGALWGIEICIELILYFNMIDRSFYKFFFMLVVTLLNMSMAAYFIYRCGRKSGELVESITRNFFKYTLYAMGIIILLTHIVLLTVFNGSKDFLFLFVFLSIFFVHVSFVYAECKNIGVREYPLPAEGDYSGNILEDGGVSEESLIIHRLICVFEHDKPFLNSQITVMEIARRIGTNRTYLSRALNHRTSKNFNQFVNYYRIKEVCSLFIANPNLDIKQFHERCGFNSFSSFSGSFKMNIGYTPGEWSRMVRERKLRHERITVEDYVI